MDEDADDGVQVYKVVVMTRWGVLVYKVVVIIRWMMMMLTTACRCTR